MMSIQSYNQDDKEINYYTEIYNNPEILECTTKRSNNYITWIKSIDSIYSTEICLSGIIKDILFKEFGDPEAEFHPKFIISRCKLSYYHDIHVIDVNHACLLHLKKEYMLPPILQNARILAKNFNYILVEVYQDKIVLIKNE